MVMSETTAHEALARFLHQIAAPRLPDLAYVWHTANESAGGAKTAGGIPLDVLKEARAGVVAGVWDWLYLGPNRQPVNDMGAFFFQGVAIELKSSKAYRTDNHGLSPEQDAWMTRYICNGWYTAVFPENDWVGAAHLFVRWVGGNVEDFNFGRRS